MRGERAEYDLAYGAFAVSGMATLVVRLMSVLPLDTGAAGGIGILIAVPLYLAGLLAMVVGAGITLWLRDEPALWVLSGLALALLADFLVEVVPTPQRNAAAIIFGVLALSGSTAWFLGARRRRLA